MLCIWKERNSRCFKDSERSMSNLKLLFFKTLLDWFSVWLNQPFFSILDLLDYVIFVYDVYTLVYFLFTWVSLFLISINLYYL